MTAVKVGNLGREPISYIYVEALPKVAIEKRFTSHEAEKLLIGGLFSGIYVNNREDDSDMYYIIRVNDERVELVHPDDFSLVSIRVMRGNSELFYFLNHKDSDQEYGHNKIISFQAELAEEKRILEDGSLIDISTYKNIPKTYEDACKNNAGRKMGFDLHSAMGSATQKAPVQGSGVSTSGNRSRSYGSSYDDDYSYSGGYRQFNKKEPTFFSRTTRRPGSNILENMKRKVLAYMEGDYEPPPIHVPKSLKADSDGTDDGFVDSDDAYDHGNLGAEHSGMYPM